MTVSWVTTVYHAQRTILTETKFGDYTVCPNGIWKYDNKDIEFRLWLRAKNPPKPPRCVPGMKYFCPPPKKGIVGL